MVNVRYTWILKIFTRTERAWPGGNQYIRISQKDLYGQMKILSRITNIVIYFPETDLQ